VHRYGRDVIQRPPAGTIPDAPGSYQFKDAQGRVIYVGKAKSLRQRLANYFQNPASLPPRTAQMVSSAESVEWIQVRNEVEALMLEFSFIKEHRPRFNVRLVDDKSYPYLAVTLSDEWPRAMVVRGRRRKGTRYFGPYAHAYAIRDTLDELLRTFPIRTCSDAKLRRHERLGKPCLLFHIEKCCAPCVGEVDPTDYRLLVAELMAFLGGETQPVFDRLEAEMREAADSMEFEQAARLRDRLATVRRAIERQQMVAETSESFDVVGVAEDDLEASVQVFFVRRGRVVGRVGFLLDKVMDLGPDQSVGAALEQIYGEEPAAGYPRLVLVPNMPEDPELYAAWLSEMRGSKVELRVPLRGDKKRLAETVTHNAQEELTRHRLRRASDHNSRSRALNELQELLALPEAPLRIECYDMSHLQGTDYVGSMVVLEDALAKRGEYRRFKVRGVAGNDDFAAMEEVLTRRLSNYIEQRALPVAERGRFAYPPQLLLVDGGKGQLSVAVRVLEELGLGGEIPVASLAKRFEEVFVPGRQDPIEVPRGSEALFLLQRIRDESHRFAVAYHRRLREQRMTESVLDEVPGLGPKRRERLIAHFGGMKGLRSAGLADLRALSWLPDEVATALHDALHGPLPARHAGDRRGSGSSEAAPGGADRAG
jgi:excinuclease ABC subunit C